MDVWVNSPVDYTWLMFDYWMITDWTKLGRAWSRTSSYSKGVGFSLALNIQKVESHQIFVFRSNWFIPFNIPTSVPSIKYCWLSTHFSQSSLNKVGLNIKPVRVNFNTFYDTDHLVRMGMTLFKKNFIYNSKYWLTPFLVILHMFSSKKE